MSSYPLDITIFIKVFNTVQDMTKSHKLLLTTLKEMELKNSDEFDQIENESSNLIALKYQTGSGIFRHFLQLGTERVENLLLEDIMKFSLY